MTGAAKATTDATPSILRNSPTTPRSRTSNCSEAGSLGVRVVPTRAALIGIATVASSLSVVMAGAIGWVGLVAPHLARAWVGPNHRVSIPAAAVVGAIYLVLVDTVARLAFSTEVPTGLATALVGIPFLAWLVRADTRPST